MQQATTEQAENTEQPTRSRTSMKNDGSAWKSLDTLFGLCFSSFYKNNFKFHETLIEFQGFASFAQALEYVKKSSKIMPNIHRKRCQSQSKNLLKNVPKKEPRKGTQKIKQNGVKRGARRDPGGSNNMFFGDAKII